MNDSIALSPEALTRIKALAQKATPGPWLNPGRQFIVSTAFKDEPIICDVKSEDARNDLAYIAAVHPYVFLAMCEEIERLRAQVATQEVLSGEDDACMTQLEVERDALEEQVARLEAAGKRIHTCKEYDTYMRKKAFGAEICNRCRHAQRTNKWGAVCWHYRGESFPEGCPRAGGGEA